MAPILSYLEKKADSKNEALRIEVNEEIERRKAIRDLQLKEVEYRSLRWPKSLMLWSVAVYVSGILWVSLLDANDRWGITIDDLPENWAWVVGAVLSYLFLDKTVSRFKR